MDYGKHRRIVTLLVIISVVLFLIACSDYTNKKPGDSAFSATEKENLKEDEMENPRTDVQTINKWFPNLRGISEALWEGEVLGTDGSNVPGPSAIHACGVLTLTQAQAEEYQKSYSWEEATPIFNAKTFSTQDISQHDWMYSEEFEEECKPQYYQGNFWFDGECVWFDVVR